jgi:hypothetical protein
MSAAALRSFGTFNNGRRANVPRLRLAQFLRSEVAVHCAHVSPREQRSASADARVQANDGLIVPRFVASRLKSRRRPYRRLIPFQPAPLKRLAFATLPAPHHVDSGTSLAGRAFDLSVIEQFAANKMYA